MRFGVCIHRCVSIRRSLYDLEKIPPMRDRGGRRIHRAIEFDAPRGALIGLDDSLSGPPELFFCGQTTHPSTPQMPYALKTPLDLKNMELSAVFFRTHLGHRENATELAIGLIRKGVQAERVPAG